MGMSDQEINRIVSNEKEWRKHIFRTMERMEERQDKIEESQNKMAIKVNSLEVKAGFFGTIFGAIAGFLGAKL